MTKEEALKKMKAILKSNKDRVENDTEAQHSDADQVLCDFLVALGHQDLVDIYDKISKWYA